MLMKKRLLILGCICAGYISIINPYHTFAAPSDSTSADEILNGWNKESDGMHYYINGEEVISSGIKIDGYWYYFTSSGCRLESDFRQKGNDRYYYDDEGRMAINTELTINGRHYKFLNSGAAFKGWDITSDGTCYYTDDGSRADDKGLKINGFWYYFQENGQMLANGWRNKSDD